MGEARDRLAQRASERGREQLDKVERVAAAARQAAAADAERQGLGLPTAQSPFREERQEAGRWDAGGQAMAAEEEPNTVACPATDPPRRPDSRPER